MYTVLLREDNQLITSVRERVIQRSKLVDNLHFLVEPTYKGVDMSGFTTLLEYLTPVSREYCTEILVKSDELYKGMLQFKLPFDTKLTKEAGKIEIQLTFLKVEMDEVGNTIQRVRKTSPTTITIIPVAAWSNVVADSSLTAIDQRLIMAEAMINAANDTLAVLDITKADSMIYNQETNVLQLTASGQPIGDSIKIGSVNVGVESIEIDEIGNMIIHYFDGRSENIGKTSSNSCVGVYIPNYSQDGILTFTLKKETKEPVYEFDINQLNDWHPIEDEATSSNYIWEKL